MRRPSEVHTKRIEEAKMRPAGVEQATTVHKPGALIDELMAYLEPSFSQYVLPSMFANFVKPLFLAPRFPFSPIPYLLT